MFKKILNFCLPHTCILCHEKSDHDIDICQMCEETLPFIRHHCTRCGLPLTHDAIICGECLINPPPFDQTHSLFHYEPPITHLIKDLKFHQKLVNSKVLGELMVKYLSLQHPPEYIIPMPLHPKRLKERGFNQSLEIAKIIAARLNIPLNVNQTKRIRYTQPQTAIPTSEREKNVKRAFQISPNFCKKSVLVVDDVITTGHTMRAFGAALRRAGAKKITVWSCARAK